MMKLKLKSIFRSKSKKSITTSKVILNDNCTTFNDLNHDLLFEIFDYLSYTDILQSFNNLNNYIQESIENYPYAIDLQIHLKYPQNIRLLKISMIDHLIVFNILKCSQISALRAISLANLRTQDVLNVFNSIPYQRIEYIYLGICAFDKTHTTLEMLSTIQTHALSLSQYRLKQCYLKEKFSVTIQNLPEQLTSLEYLQIVACQDLFVISQLISRTPNLKYLHVSTLNIHQNPFISKLSYLTTLSFRPHLDCSVEEFRLFIQEYCSNLKKLIVELFVFRSKPSFLHINKSRWLTIFPNQLEYFHFKCVQNSSVHFDMLIYDDKQYRSPVKEKILLEFSNDTEKHYCQILIDPPLISVWMNED